MGPPMIGLWYFLLLCCGVCGAENQAKVLHARALWILDPGSVIQLQPRPQLLKFNFLKLSSAGIFCSVFGEQRKYSLSRNSLSLALEETLN